MNSLEKNITLQKDIRYLLAKEDINILNNRTFAQLLNIHLLLNTWEIDKVRFKESQAAIYPTLLMNHHLKGRAQQSIMKEGIETVLLLINNHKKYIYLHQRGFNAIDLKAHTLRVSWIYGKLHLIVVVIINLLKQIWIIKEGLLLILN